MIETKQRDIQGLQVTTVQLPAMRAYGVFSRLGAILGPALAELDIANVQGMSMSDDIGSLGPAVGKLLAGLSTDTALVLSLLQSTTVVVDEAKIDLLSEAAINKVFTGNFLGLLATLKFAIEVNFADFLAAGLAALPAQKVEAETKEAA